MTQTDASAIVMGLGGTVDVEIDWSPDVLGMLAREEGVGVADTDPHAPITDLASMVRVVLGFVATGTGGERFAASPDAVREFAARFSSRVTIGGTAVRAALAMDVLGIASTVSIVEADPTLRRLLPESVRLLAAGETADLAPHLIVQYPADAQVHLEDGVLRAPLPNRIIIANDPPNRELTLAPNLPQTAAEANIVLLSSLNAIQEAEVLQARLAQLSDLIRALPSSVTVVWEDAGDHRPEFRATVASAMSPMVDIFSMNEDELAEFVASPVDLLDVESVTQALVLLRRAVPARTLVVHSSRWALALGDRAARLRGALRGGITMASTRYLHGDGMTADNYHEVAQRVPDSDASTFAKRLEARGADLVCEPAFRLATEDPTTIGLGDAFIGGFIAALESGEWR